MYQLGLSMKVKGLVIQKDSSVPYEITGAKVQVNRELPIVIGHLLKAKAI